MSASAQRLATAIKHGTLEEIQSLLDSEIDLNVVFNGNTVLELAVRSSNTLRTEKIVGMLLDAGIEPNINTVALITAICSKYTSNITTRMCLSVGIDANIKVYDSLTFLTYLLVYMPFTVNARHTVKMLLEADADAGVKDSRGKTIVALAVHTCINKTCIYTMLIESFY